MRPRFLLRDALGSVIKGTLARPWRTLLFCFVVSVSIVICGVVVHVATRQKHFYISFGCHHIASRFVLYLDIALRLYVFSQFHDNVMYCWMWIHCWGDVVPSCAKDVEGSLAS